jgi:RNA polymerase sigma factor (sigma-70 family)
LRTVVLSASPAAWDCVDDLIQDVYAHLWRDDFHVLRQWQRERPLRAYLRTVVTRLVWDRLSRLQPVWEQLEDDPWMASGAQLEQSDVPPTPEEQVVANELSRMVRSALDRLNVGYRQILELRYRRELSYREIAIVIGITPTNAGVRTTRGALTHLKEELPQLIDDGCFFFRQPGVSSECNKLGGSSLIQSQQGRNRS